MLRGVWRDLRFWVSREFYREGDLECKPRIDVFHWREDLFARVELSPEEALKFEEFFTGDFVFELGQPALM